jgi:hypothetical protein
MAVFEVESFRRLLYVVVSVQPVGTEIVSHTGRRTSVCRHGCMTLQLLCARVLTTACRADCWLMLFARMEMLYCASRKLSIHTVRQVLPHTHFGL